jgi:class 3 adenylate cyclase
MGYGNTAAITAIGDAVNTASRLESLTKNFACELVVSEETVSRAELDLSAFPQREIEIRGKREMLAIRTLASAAQLPVTILTTSTGRPRQASNGSLSPSIQTNSTDRRRR